MPIAQETKDKVVSEYESGATVKDILKNNDIDYKEFWKIRSGAGIAIRKAGEMRFVLNKVQEGEINKLYLEGSSIRVLAEKYDVDRSVINRTLDYNKIQKRSISAANHKKSFPEKEICEAYQNTTRSIRSICFQFDTTNTSVKRILIKNGVPLRAEHLPEGTGKGAPSKIGPHTARIIELYQQGLSISKIRDIIGVNTNTPNYTRLIREAGLTIRTRGEQNKRYSIDEFYFSHIDSPDKAYWLGIMYTDGCVRTYPRKKVVLELHSTDEITVKALQTTLRSTAPLSYTNKSSVVFSAMCPQMVDDLIKYGLMHNKTKNLTYPHWMPDNLFPHFARGVMDGDGYVSIGKNRPCVGFCGGAVDFINGFASKLENTYGIKTSKAITQEGNFTFQLTSFGSILRFLNIIYKDASFIMPRKFRNYKAMLLAWKDKPCVEASDKEEAQIIIASLEEKFKDIL